ncbi:Gfo/Idh/MocA family oxidoreductase [Devosia sp.]|uniref:Gfo/Idh/MocA family protein n=1 Tax=Devosia sp. TaxID=1871048 RepID=UPI002AFEC7DF|nr:Gfo/Idh/MocA family oxidoreductase [Devosia sp.]
MSMQDRENSWRLAFVGSGSIAAHHARLWTSQPGVTISAICDVSEPARQGLVEVISAAGASRPNTFASMEEMIAACRDTLDAVYICTPHCFHAAQALAAIESGLDVLLEKPMVMTAEEARAITAAQERSGSTVVIAYQGAMSPLVQDSAARIAKGEFGDLQAVSGVVWEDWAERYSGHWKQKPEISGGGFMFDTGAHMLNTISMLVNSRISEITALAENAGREVDIVSSVTGRIDNGGLVSLLAVGNAPVRCASQITLFLSKAIIRIDAWGEWREIETVDGKGERETIDVRKGMLASFMDIRQGKQINPSPPSQGERFAELWDAIKSAWLVASS